MAEPQHRGDLEPSSLDEWVAGFTRNAALRPVLIVAVLSFAALGAGALVLAIRDRNLAAIGAVALVALGTADLVVRDLRHRRFGLATRLVTALWMLSAAAAAGAVALGMA